MKNPIMLILLALSFLTSCKMAEVQLPRDLEASAQEYNVHGKRRIRWKKKIKFGEYAAKESRKSFPWTSESDWGIRTKRGKHHFKFEIENKETNNSLEGYAINSYKAKSASFVERMIGIDSAIPFDVDDEFVGSVRSKASGKTWNFIVSNISTTSFKNARGYLSDNESIIEIREVTRAGKGWLPGSDEGLVLGFAFRENGKHLGVVRTYRDGKIWIEGELSGEKKDIIAAMSAALLMKKDFDEN